MGRGHIKKPYKAKKTIESSDRMYEAPKRLYKGPKRLYKDLEY